MLQSIRARCFTYDQQLNFLLSAAHIIAFDPTTQAMVCYLETSRFGYQRYAVYFPSIEGVVAQDSTQGRQLICRVDALTDDEAIQEANQQLQAWLTVPKRYNTHTDTWEVVSEP